MNLSGFHLKKYFYSCYCLARNIFTCLQVFDVFHLFLFRVTLLILLLIKFQLFSKKSFLFL